MEKILIAKSIKYRKINIPTNNALFKSFLPKLCHKLDKQVPHSLS